MKIAFLIVCSTCFSFGGELIEIKDHSSDARVINLLARFDNERYINELRSGGPEEVFMDAMTELMTVGRILDKIIIYLNVSPRIPVGYQGKDWLFSGVDPKSILEDNIRKDYLKDISNNQKNILIREQVMEIHSQLTELAKDQISKFPENARLPAERLMSSIERLKFCGDDDPK